jgi:RNA polymerase sigma-70 factor (ECF subfamily)
MNAEPAAPAERGPESIEKEELYERVLSILNGLPRIYKDIIMLRHLRKMSYKDIARFMGIAEATVESRLHRAKLLLKERLKDLY